MVEPDRAAAGRTLAIAANLAAAALLVAAALAHGRLTDRWGTSAALAGAIARLERVPRSIGDWRGQDVPMDRRQVDRAGIEGYLSRAYRNAKDGRELTVLLVCGRPGPIAVHTPDVCYEGVGYVVKSDPVVEDIAMGGGHLARFFQARFEKAGATVEALDIAWAWNARGPWEAPANPRVAFATRPYLYKIYLIARPGVASWDQPPTTPSGVTGDGPGADVAILEAIDRALSTTEGPAVGLSPRQPGFEVAVTPLVEKRES